MKIQISDGGLTVEDVENGVQIALRESAPSSVSQNGQEPAEDSLEKIIRDNDVVDLAAWLMTFAELHAEGDVDVWARFETTHKDSLLQMARESRQHERQNRPAPPDSP